MAPDPPAKKRKRARPGQSNNRQPADASPADRRDADDAPDEPPRKRGRPADAPSKMPAQPRKRAPPANKSPPSRPRRSQRPRAAEREPTPELVDGESRARRGRRPAAQAQLPDRGDEGPPTEPDAADGTRPRKRHNPPLKRPREDATGGEDPPTSARGSSRRPSPKLTRCGNDVSPEPDEEPDTTPPPSEAPDDASGQPRNSQRTSRARPKAPPSTRAQRKQRQSGAASATEPPHEDARDASRPSPPVASPGDPERRRRRQPAAQDGAASASPAPPPRPYAHVVPRVRRVRQSTIAAKWSPLTGPSLTAVSALLHHAHRPILQRLSGTLQRRAHASAALRLMARRIARKVDARALPFPPAAMAAAPRRPGPQQQAASDGGRELELDFETVLDAKAALEAQLEPLAHAVELLRREKNAVERELEGDYEALRELEARARSQAREQRSLLKKAHPLAPQAMTPVRPHDARVGEPFLAAGDGATAPASSGNLFTDLAASDEGELQGLAGQLAGHVESMRANLRQTAGVAPQLVRARAALQAVLLAHLDQEQYERVVLG